MTGEDLKPTSARERRQSNSFLARISEKLVVRIRKSDPLDLVFSGMLSMPMLEAAMKYEDVRDKFNTSPNEAGRMEAARELLNAENTQELRKFAQEYACKMVIDPPIIFDKEVAAKNPDALWVGELDFLELMGIFNADEKNSEVRTRQAVEEFRRTEQSSTDNAGRAGEAIRTETQQLDLPKRDYIGA